jgi:hypothetical protein
MFKLFSSQTLHGQPHSSARRSVSARVVFVSFEAGRVVIDLVTKESVVALEAVLPYASWAVAASAMLDRWAQEGAEVELAFLRSSGGSRAQLKVGTSLVLLDLAHEVGKSRPAGTASPGAANGQQCPGPVERLAGA